MADIKYPIANKQELDNLKQEVTAHKEDYVQLENDVNNILPTVKGLPFDKHKWDSNRVVIFQETDLSKLTPPTTGLSVDNEILFNGKPTIKLTSTSNATIVSRLTLPAPLDLTTKNYIDLDVYIRSQEDLAKYAVQVMLGTDVSNSFIYSFSAPIKSQSYINNEWLKLRIALDENTITGSPSMANISYVSINMRAGTDKTTSINIGAIHCSTVEKGVVQMHFDDGYKNQYEIAYPIMNKYGLKGLMNIITGRMGVNPESPTWQQLKELQDNGWVICSHTHTHPELATLTEAELHAEFALTRNTLKWNGFELGSKMLVVPGGSYNPTVDKIGKQYFLVVRGASITSGLTEFPPNSNRYQVYISPGATSTVQSVKDKIDVAISSKKQLILAWHQLTNEVATGLTVTSTFFDEICAYIRQKIDEGVLICPTWRDVYMQSPQITPIDSDGNIYANYSNGKLQLHDISF